MVANMTQPPMVLSISWGSGEVYIYIYIYIYILKINIKNKYFKINIKNIIK